MKAKTQSPPPVRFLSKLALGALITASSACIPLQAQIIVDFAGGGSNTSPETSVVDAFSGKAGLGWDTAWETRTYGTGALGSAQVLATGAIWGGDNHLTVTPSNNGTSTGVSLARSYESFGLVSLNKPITISFQFAIDNLGTFLSTASNEIFIGENGTNSANRTSGSSWVLQAFGGSNTNQSPGKGSAYSTARQGQWNLGTSANGFVPTGILLQQNVMYTFTLDINPTTYDYTVSLSNGITTFQSGLLDFHSNQVLGRYIVFGEQYATGQGATYSFGNLSIIPEPTGIGLAAIGLTLLGTVGYRRRTSSR